MKLKGAIVGIGNIALGSHIPAYLREQDRVEIVAGIDRSPKNLEKFKKIFPNTKTYLDDKNLFDHPIDFLDICTPPGSHKYFIEQATSHKINILCEKPLCTSMEEMKRIVSTIKTANIVFQPCHQYHYSVPWQKALKMIDEGRIGEPHLVQFEVLRKEPNPGNIHWQPSWRVDKTHSGGGIVMDHGTHLFYLAMSLLGKPHFLEAKTMCLHHKDTGLEDTAWIIMQHDGGMSRFDLTWASFQRGIRYRILGRTGEIVISETEIFLHNQDTVYQEPINEGISKDSKHSEWFVDLIEDFLDRIENKQIDWAPLNEAVLSLQCALQAYEAAEQSEKKYIQPI